MKLRILSEGALGLREDEYADAIANQQSLANLVYWVRTKLRNMLEAIGLAEGGRNQITAPIGPAIAPTNRLLTTATKQVKSEIQSYLQGFTPKGSLEGFWGFRLPTGWYDVEAGQRGKPTDDGVLDDLIRTVVIKSKDLDTEGKITLVNELTEHLSH